MTSETWMGDRDLRGFWVGGGDGGSRKEIIRGHTKRGHDNDHCWNDSLSDIRLRKPEGPHAYRQLCNRIVDDVKGIGVKEV